MKITVRPSEVRGELTAPASKSYAQRAVAAALLAEGRSTLLNMDLCNDTSAAIDAARRLGAVVSAEGSTYTVTGGFDPASDVLDIGESGLSARLFTPIASLSDKNITVTGHGSILSRPVSMMERPLRELGVQVSTNNGFLPITVRGPLRGGVAVVDGSTSSQFITGLLMALPLSENDSTLVVENLNSRPYIDMTIGVAKAFGVEITHNDYHEFYIQGRQKYMPATYNIEGDWSGASCLLVAGAVAGSITVRNLDTCSLQADAAIITALAKAGANIMVSPGGAYTVAGGDLRGFEFDATHCPDLFPALAALAANCKGTTVIRGTKRLTNKESDRAQTIAETFGTLGIHIDISQEDTMIIRGGSISGGVVHSHNDHRIAMAAAVAALNAASEVTIDGAEAVEKSYPCFWKDFGHIQKL